jgi:hypothetical protein
MTRSTHGKHFQERKWDHVYLLLRKAFHHDAPYVTLKNRGRLALMDRHKNEFKNKLSSPLHGKARYLDPILSLLPSYQVSTEADFLIFIVRFLRHLNLEIALGSTGTFRVPCLFQFPVGYHIGVSAIPPGSRLSAYLTSRARYTHTIVSVHVLYIPSKGAWGRKSWVRCPILIQWIIPSRLAVVRSFSEKYWSRNRLRHYCLIWFDSCLIWGVGWSSWSNFFLGCSPSCLKVPKKISEKIGIFLLLKGHCPRQFIFRAPLRPSVVKIKLLSWLNHLTKLNATKFVDVSSFD